MRPIRRRAIGAGARDVARPRRSGFTLAECLIALTITALALVNFQIVTKAGNAAAQSGLLRSSVSDELNLTVNRVSLALMGSREADLLGAPMAPAHSTSVEYATVLGFEEGEPVLGATESISWEMGGDSRGRILWQRRDTEAATDEPSDPLRHSVVWSSSIPEAYLGEALGNEEDDNENGLLNEQGLAFTRSGSVVEIRLTVQRVNSDGVLIAQEKTHRIACRN